MHTTWGLCSLSAWKTGDELKQQETQVMDHECEHVWGEEHGVCNHLETWMSFFSCLFTWELKIKTPAFQVYMNGATGMLGAWLS